MPPLDGEKPEGRQVEALPCEQADDMRTDRGPIDQARDVRQPADAPEELLERQQPRIGDGERIAHRQPIPSDDGKVARGVYRAVPEENAGPERAKKQKEEWSREEQVGVNLMKRGGEHAA